MHGDERRPGLRIRPFVTVDVVTDHAGQPVHELLRALRPQPQCHPGHLHFFDRALGNLLDECLDRRVGQRCGDAAEVELP
jgi:hypothetical protein